MPLKALFLVVSRTGREVFQHVEKFYANFFSKIFRKTVARRSCECRELVATKFWRIYNAKFWGHSYGCRASVARRWHDSLATIWRENKIKRHSYDSRATLARMSRDCRTNLYENKLHSRESRETLSRMSRDIFSKLDRNSRICRKNVYSMRLQRCVYIVYLCREIVANYSRTSLQLSHSSEIGALEFNFYSSEF